LKLFSSPAQALRLASIVTLLNVLTASGFAIVGLVNPKLMLPAADAPTQASLLFALYAAARSLPLALIVMAAVYRRSAPALIVLGVLAGMIQLADAGVGIVQGDPGKIIGPLILAALQSFATFKLARATRVEV
jgi:hypothetical protein